MTTRPLAALSLLAALAGPPPAPPPAPDRRPLLGRRHTKPHLRPPAPLHPGGPPGGRAGPPVHWRLGGGRAGGRVQPPPPHRRRRRGDDPVRAHVAVVRRHGDGQPAAQCLYARLVLERVAGGAVLSVRLTVPHPRPPSWSSPL